MAASLPDNMKSGRGGKSFQDRELASSVRSKALHDVLLVLSDDAESKKKVAKWGDYKKQLLLKISSSLLPKLNEHTGADGEKLFPAPLLGGKTKDGIQSNDSTE